MDIKNIDEWIKNPENKRHISYVCDNMDCNIVAAMDKERPHFARKDEFIAERYQVTQDDNDEIYQVLILGSCGNCENNIIN